MIINIPIQQIPEESLNRLLEEFVTRDGTQYGEKEYSQEEMVRQVKSLLEKNKAHLQYDDEKEEFNIILVDTYLF